MRSKRRNYLCLLHGYRWFLLLKLVAPTGTLSFCSNPEDHGCKATVTEFLWSATEKKKNVSPRPCSVKHSQKSGALSPKFDLNVPNNSTEPKWFCKAQSTSTWSDLFSASIQANCMCMLFRSSPLCRTQVKLIPKGKKRSEKENYIRTKGLLQTYDEFQHLKMKRKNSCKKLRENCQEIANWLSASTKWNCY